VRYHNITPPEFFAGWSAGYVDECARARAQLDAFATLDCELYLGDSPFNVADFTARGVGADRCAVLAPFHQVAQLAALAPDSSRIPDAVPLLLMVGRLAPNKGHLDLVDALAACIASDDEGAHLLIIGKLDPNLASYGEALRAHIQERSLQSRVTLLHDADGAELRAAYERADALVMLSQHEGFCVPLIEAMALGTPVIALASSAIPWTLGDAGLLWEAADPHLIAASVARLRRDEELRRMLRERGLKRYADAFAPAPLARQLGQLMGRISTA
jgi:glycosyltransferase involved in cell wall biosynthesis